MRLQPFLVAVIITYEHFILILQNTYFQQQVFIPFHYHLPLIAFQVNPEGVFLGCLLFETIKPTRL